MSGPTSPSPADKPRELAVVQQAAGIAISGPEFEKGAGNQWSAERVDDKRVLLTVSEGRLGLAPQADGKLVAVLAVEVFQQLVLSLSHAQWSGALHIDTHYGLKKLYLSRGEIVFAASSVIDDRLGEVIYRESKITLDELTDAAAQVTKGRKFGQILLSSGRFGNVELWDALKLQVKQILRSLFMAERVYFEMQPGTGLAPTEVVFEASTVDLLSECTSFGAAYRSFLGRLRADSQAVLAMARSDLPESFRPGTFIGDLVELVVQHPNVQELLNACRLIDNYTVLALMNLVNLGICRIMPDVDSERKPTPALAPLRARLDGYGFVLNSVRKGFTDAGREFPLRDLTRFVASCNPDGFASIFVEDKGEIGKACALGMLAQCTSNPPRILYFVNRVDSMIQFLLQIAGDNLDFSVAKKIRGDYRNIST